MSLKLKFYLKFNTGFAHKVIKFIKNSKKSHIFFQSYSMDV
jgi:hypothetical protein